MIKDKVYFKALFSFLKHLTPELSHAATTIRFLLFFKIIFNRTNAWWPFQEKDGELQKLLNVMEEEEGRHQRALETVKQQCQREIQDILKQCKEHDVTVPSQPCLLPVDGAVLVTSELSISANNCLLLWTSVLTSVKTHTQRMHRGILTADLRVLI